MQRVFVVDTNKKPLAPCQPARARMLLRKGKAAVYRREPFTIILKRGIEETVPPAELRIVPGSRTTGIAVVGETGSGKSTLAKLLTRLMDPTEGQVLVDGVDLRRVRFSSLRSRVVLVPQEGFLFDASLLENIRFGRPEASVDDVHLALTELGLDEWAEGLPLGLDTAVGQRGESLSAGERQLVAIVRAYLADVNLLLQHAVRSQLETLNELDLALLREWLATMSAEPSAGMFSMPRTSTRNHCR